MFGRTYTLFCANCRTEFKTKHKNVSDAFYQRHKGTCPCCGEPLTHIPMTNTGITLPPNCKTYPRYKRIEDLDNPSTLEYSKWSRYMVMWENGVKRYE